MKYIKTIALIAVLLLATPALAFIPGDINQDDTVDSIDLTILSAAYNSKPGDLNWNVSADITSDGMVDFNDLVLFAQNYGSTTPPVVIVDTTPMPASTGSGSLNCMHYWPAEYGGGVTPCYLEGQATIKALGL